MTPDQLQRLEALENRMRDHNHSGLGDTRVNLRDIFGAIKVVSAAPINKPTSIAEQFVIYKNGATLRFYWFDTVEGAWHYIVATA